MNCEEDFAESRERSCDYDVVNEFLDSLSEEEINEIFDVSTSVYMNDIDPANQLVCELKASNKPIVLDYNEKYDSMPLEEVKKLVEDGDAIALYELAIRLDLGIDGTEVNKEKAYYLYIKLLRQERNAKAMLRVGYMFEEGVFGEERKPECKDWYLLGSQLGNSDCLLELGDLYSYGSDLFDVDFEFAKQAFEEGINKGNHFGFNYLGDLYVGRYNSSDEERSESDGKTAISCYKKAYDFGKREYASYALGKSYFYGLGLSDEENPEKQKENNILARKYCEEALKYGYEECNYYIGILHCIRLEENPYDAVDISLGLEYLSKSPESMKDIAYERSGYICEECGDINKAIEFYQMAAEVGSEQAKDRLRGLTSGKNMKALLECDIEGLLSYYDKGVEEACYLIGDSYHYGKRGAIVDYEKAFSFYRHIIDNELKDSDFAFFGLGCLYENGQGVIRDISRAIDCYKKAADMGHRASCTKMGYFFYKGDAPLSVDYEKATTYLSIGSDKGDYIAKRLLAEMYLRGCIGGREEAGKAIELLLQVLEAAPNEVWTNRVLGIMYETGVSDNGEILLSKNLNKAIELLEKASALNDYDATDHLEQIYGDKSSPLYSYEKALVFADEMLLYDNPAKYTATIYLGLNPDYWSEKQCNPAKGIEAAHKLLLELKIENPSPIKEMVMDMLTTYYEKKAGRESSIAQEGYHFLLDNLDCMGLCFSNEKALNSLSETIRLVWANLTTGYNSNANGIKEYKYSIGLLDRINESSLQNEYIRTAARPVLIREYSALGGMLLDDHEFSLAKACFEKAASLGSDDAEKKLKHFKTNIFGSITFK